MDRNDVLEEVARRLVNDANTAYCRASTKSRADLCKGEEAKIATGKFTLENLKALEAVRADFGAAAALWAAAKTIRAMKTQPARPAQHIRSASVFASRGRHCPDSVKEPYV